MNYKLNEKELKILEMAAEDCDLRIDYEYSGRAMFGKCCIGIKYQDDYDLESLCEFISENGAPKLALSIATRWRTDNRGKGYIKYNHF